MAQTQTRLCPNCANSIALDAQKCPYCKADVKAAAPPQWPGRTDENRPPAPAQQKIGVTLGSKIVMVLGLMFFAVGIYFVVGQKEHQDLAPILAERQKQIQEQEQKIKGLEEQLAKLRIDFNENTAQVKQLRGKIDERDKTLAAAQKRLTQAQRESERLAANQAAARQPVRRSGDANSVAPVPARRTIEVGLYETTRPTTVFEGPDSSSRILSRVSKGTQITAVRAAGDWLEIRSKHGNPPGFIRADDAMFVAKAN